MEMTAPFRSSFLIAALCLGLAGCYPALRTVQPKARFVVQDASQHPIEGATVMLVTRRMWLGAQTMTPFRTDAAGKISLRATHQWEWQVMLPDGVSWYEWSYCIEKPGYRAVAELKPEFRKPVIVMMERTEKHSACAWPTVDAQPGPMRVVEE